MSASSVHHQCAEPDPIDLRWQGPYRWPQGRRRVDDVLPPSARADGKRGGVYLMTVGYERGGYIIYWAGITKRPFPVRFGEHKREFLRGGYTILDVQSLGTGVRKEVWHGWGQARERQHLFAARKEELNSAALEQINETRIFVAHVDSRRLQARVEAAIVTSLYKAPSLEHILDKGYHLEPRYGWETPIPARNHCDHVLHALPHSLEI